MVFRKFGRIIFKAYESYPITLNSLIGGTVYMSGEITVQINQNSNICNQELLQKKVDSNNFIQKARWHINKIDWERTRYLGALGAAENGIFMLTWYKFLNKVFGSGICTNTVSDHFKLLYHCNK